RTLIIAELFKRERRAFAPRCVRRLRARRARSNRARAARLVHRAPQPRAHGDRRDEHDGDDDERQPIRWRFDRLSLFTHMLKRTRARAVEVARAQVLRWNEWSSVYGARSRSGNPRKTEKARTDDGQIHFEFAHHLRALSVHDAS